MRRDAGAGEDAVMAARHGANVTCIDISQGMLDQVKRKLERESLNAELICVNAFDFDRFGQFDVVAANYFLNVFRRNDMKRMLNHTAKFVRESGKYLIADVSTAQGILLAKAFIVSYLKLAMGSFWLMGLVPWHENYDYPSFFRDAGLKHEHTEYFRFAKKGPILFQSIVATK
ncbi:MAG: class I SAM-dependent methyltransferase [Planctomycetota bacterium]